MILGPQRSHLGDVTSRPFGINRADQLGDDVLQGPAALNHGAQLRHGAMRHDAAAVQDHDIRAEPFDTIEQAFAFILEHEGRVRLSWSRTVIAGEERPLDFTGRYRTDNAGRITMESDGLSAGKWQSFPAAFNPKTGRLSGTMGVHDTRDAAVAWIERKYTETMSGRFETLE